MEKVIRNGKVAVLYSPGFGAGWYTWNENKQLLFHPKLVELVERKNNTTITKEWCSENLGVDDVYCGGASNLTIEWITEGTAFKIDEYDGSEYITTLGDITLIA